MLSSSLNYNRIISIHEHLDNNYLLECSKAILRFIIESDAEYLKMKHFGTPSNLSMTDVLEKHDTNMFTITVYMNCKFKIIDNPEWEIGPTHFFSNRKKCIPFYKTIINMLDRSNKLRKLSNNIKCNV